MRQAGDRMSTAGSQAGRIKIAVQKSGRLTDNSLDLLARCGLRYSRGQDQLVCFGENLPLDILLVRDDDIPALVRDDVCDLGIVGQNVIEEKRLAFGAQGQERPFEFVSRLDFGRCRLSIAVPDGVGVREFGILAGSTHRDQLPAYPRALARRARHPGGGADARRRSRNRTEPRPRGCDLRSGLERRRRSPPIGCCEVETVLESRAALIRTPAPVPPEKREWLQRLLQRIDGVQR